MDDVLFLSLLLEALVAYVTSAATTTDRLAGQSLTEFISQFEPLYYDTAELQTESHRSKRSPDGRLALNAHAYGRTFKMRLRRDTDVFSSNLVIENGTGGTVMFDPSRAYVGYIEDEDESTVHGIVTSEGIFEGKIRTSDELYVIERARRYFKDDQDTTSSFHSVIYKQSAVRTEILNSSFCRSAELHQKLQRSLMNDKNNNNNNNRDNSNNNDGNTQQADSVAGGGVGGGGGVGPGSARPPRTRRSVRTAQGYAKPVSRYDSDSLANRYYFRQQLRQIDPTKTTCTMFIQADHLFYEKFDRNEETVIEQLTQHIQGVNEIYRQIDFDDNGVADNIHFIIKRIKIWTSPKIPGYKFAGNYGVETFLELLSEDNFDVFCLAYLFTYRDFDGGTLGLAWTGDLQNAGGVCEKNGQYRGSFKSLNSGLVTILNYGKDVPPSVSHVTMAHEVGHNIGSQHDPETTECSPGGTNGNYIMYARATSGDRPNNNKFSICSKQAMAQVMAVKARGDHGCFIPSTDAICGNGVVEGDEECDCGWEDGCQEKCCYPQVSTVRFGVPCTRKPGAQCSPSEGPCCSDRCQFLDNRICRSPTTCRSASYCNGSSAVCPPSFSRMGARFKCDDDPNCHHEDCHGSICLAYDLEPCHCPSFRDQTPCRICCKEPGEGRPCRSAYYWNIDVGHVPADTHDRRSSASSSSSSSFASSFSCSKRKGCDQLAVPKCTEGDTEGPFASLRHLLFSAEVMRNMKHWFTVYWYIPTVVAAGFFASLAVLIKICSGRKGIALTSGGVGGGGGGSKTGHLKMSYVEPHKALTVGHGTNYRVLPDHQPQPPPPPPAAPACHPDSKRFGGGGATRLPPPEIIVKSRPVLDPPEVGESAVREKGGRREITSWV